MQVGEGGDEARLYQSAAMAKREFTSNYKNNFTCSFAECAVDKITFFQNSDGKKFRLIDFEIFKDPKNFQFNTADSNHREQKVRSSLLELYTSKFQWSKTIKTLLQENIRFIVITMQGRVKSTLSTHER